MNFYCRFGFLRALVLSVTLLGSLSAAEKKSGTAPRESQSTGKNSVAAAKVDINTADLSTLESLPGVGREIARAIVAARPFKSVADLERVEGIGPAKMKELKGLVTASKPEPPRSAKSKSSGKREKVDINTADTKTLESLPGVGPEIAREIVAQRPFKSIDDLDRVRGIGAERLEQLRTEVFVSVPTAPAKRKLGEPTLPPTGRRSDAAARQALIDINTASQEELEALPGIGPVKAAAIIEARKERRFSSKEDIMRVKGIKEGTYEEIKDKILVR
jgi:competence protein ComEA